MLSFNDVNILGSIIDTTFGRASSRAGGIAIRAHLSGDFLVVTYHEVVNIAKDRDKIQQIDPVRDRAIKATKECVARVEKEFSAAAGHKLKLKANSEGGDLEAMGYNFLSPVRPTLFRYTTKYLIG